MGAIDYVILLLRFFNFYAILFIFCLIVFTLSGVTEVTEVTEVTRMTRSYGALILKEHGSVYIYFFRPLSWNFNCFVCLLAPAGAFCAIVHLKRSAGSSSSHFLTFSLSPLQYGEVEKFSQK